MLDERLEETVDCCVKKTASDITLEFNDSSLREPKLELEEEQNENADQAYVLGYN